MTGPRAGALVVEERRGRVVEATHPVSAVLVDAEGRVVEQVGEDLVTTWRSGAKPFQLEVSAAQVQAPLQPWDLAIGTSSHSAQPVHVARVVDLLARLGCEEEHLLCGAHRPIHGPSADALLRESRPARALHNNCSGKHAFMAGACRRQGWPADYRDLDHPLQRRIQASVDRHTGCATHAVIDGCGVPCFVLPLSGMARAYARLAAAPPAAGLLGQIADAMAAHPHLVSGDGRDDLAAATGATRPTLFKVGAMGLMCAALREEGLGLAVKVHSGGGDARAIALASVLGRWRPGLLPAAAMAPWAVVHNAAGRVVGDRVAVWG